MDNESPLPPTVQKPSQNIRKTAAAILSYLGSCAEGIWSQELLSSDRAAKPQYWVDAFVFTELNLIVFILQAIIWQKYTEKQE